MMRCDAIEVVTYRRLRVKIINKGVVEDTDPVELCIFPFLRERSASRVRTEGKDCHRVRCWTHSTLTSGGSQHSDQGM